MKKSEPIAIALSGGIDSLVAASLLKESGQPVVGLHFLTGYEADAPNAVGILVEGLAAQLAIPVNVVDLSNDFERCVVDYFSATYRAGQTPNPCLVCNPAIKFEALAKIAQTHGATQIATGHYARILPGPGGRMRLLKGADPTKDQSYFLARLTQAQLRRARLPLGELTKAQTRAMARERGLTPIVTEESQDICFIANGSYGDFLAGRPGFTFRPGPIVTADGKQIGTHHGLHRYTVGQRRGINIPAAAPYYVVRLEPNENRLVVGFEAELQASRCRVSDINWIAPAPDVPTATQVRIRYRHTAVSATLIPTGEHEAEIRFDAPQKAVTPGQGAVFYDGDEVLGGGWIQ